jgi:hypothetical protein
MGRAREGFGSGAAVACDCPLAPVPPGETPAGQGAAADAHQRAATTLTTDSRRLAQQDIAGDTQLAAAVAQSHSGRRSMDAVISAAIADVEAMGLSTGTPQGKAALIAAIERRLLDTKATVGEGTTDAGTHAAASEATAAGYRGIGTDPRAATMPAQMPMSGMPMGGMPAMGGMPQMGGGGLSSVMPTSALQDLSSLGGRADGGGGGSARGGGSAQIDRLAVSQVGFHRKGFPGGPAAYRGYINEMLDIQGVTDPKARERWMTGFLTAARRESAFNPLAINLDDSNAKSSTGNAADAMPNRASRGGVQTIPSTFAAFHQAGTSNNIYDPVANLCAARNYLMFDPKYGVAADGSDLGRIAQFNPRSAARGY